MTAHDLLTKGANVSLVHRSSVEESRVHAVVSWSDPDGGADVDVSALLLGQDGRVRGDADFVFYNAPTSADGSVRLMGSDRPTTGPRTASPSTWRRCPAR